MTFENTCFCGQAHQITTPDVGDAAAREYPCGCGRVWVIQRLDNGDGNSRLTWREPEHGTRADTS